LPIKDNNRIWQEDRQTILSKSWDNHMTLVMLRKNLVIMMLEGAGFQVTDLGVDIDVDTLIQKVEELRPQVLGLSALLTTTMPEMARVIKALEAGGLREKVKVMVGGAPVDQKFADQIGADGYGKDAAQAVELTRKLAGGS